MSSANQNNQSAATANLPILPEIALNRTASHSFSADTLTSETSTSPVPCTATPIPLDSPTRPLSTRQLNAIPLILSGYSDFSVAESVGVRREAVCRWRNQHPQFIAELNRQRRLLHATTADRYHSLLNQAMRIFERYHSSDCYDLDEKLKAAAILLRTAPRRAFTAPAPDPTLMPTNPDEILDQLLSAGLTPSPDDSSDDDAPPPPPPAPKPKRRSK